MKHLTFILLLAGALPLNAVTRYVSLDGNHIAPFTAGWASAATNIQDAIDIAIIDDEIIVSNGVYRSGGRPYNGSVTSRVVVPIAITVRSLNGAENTRIEGRGPLGVAAIRCVYLAENATLCGFTLTNGYTYNFDTYQNNGGGGVYSPNTSTVVSNCIIRRCSASNGGGTYRGTVYNTILTHNSGSGANGSLMYNCLITHNTAGQGGGAFGSALYNCTVASNSASVAGGGVRDSSAYNSIVYHNSGGDHYGFTAYYTCTPPGAFLTGSHNITNDPAFIDVTSDYHLPNTSPCINTGTNMAWMAGMKDLDGFPRISGGHVDMGCYELVPEPAFCIVFLLCMLALCRTKLK